MRPAVRDERAPKPVHSGLDVGHRVVIRRGARQSRRRRTGRRFRGSRSYHRAGVSQNPRNTDAAILQLGEQICDDLRAGATGYEESQRLQQSGSVDAYQAAMLIIPARAYLCRDVPPDAAR